MRILRPLPLVFLLIWGGVKQDSMKRDIQRLYGSKDAEGPHAWTM